MFERIPVIGSFFAKPPTNPSAAEKKREQVHQYLEYGQYGLIAYSAYLLLLTDTRTIFALSPTVLSVYLEKLAISFYAHVKQDPRTAYYLGSQLTKISQLSSFFNPVVHPIINKLNEMVTVEPVDLTQYQAR